jgi:cytochrome P450
MTNVTLTDYNPLAPAVNADPYPYYAELRRHSPVRHVTDLDLWVVSRHADVRRVMHDHTGFSSEAMAAAVARPAEYAIEAADEPDEDEPPPVSIVGTDGETHSRLRHIVNRGFTPRRIAELEPAIRRIARELLDDFAASGGGDLQHDVAVPFPTVVIAELLGVDPDRRQDFRRWSEHMVFGVFEQADQQQQREIAASAEEMMDWLDGVIAERTGHSGSDLLSVLLSAELEGGALSHDELKTFAVTLLVAGSITTAYLIGNGILALLEDPAALDTVRADGSLIPLLTEETLRYDAPTQMMFRTATDDIEIAGTTVPRGATVAPLLGSANRDETVFADPDRFDVGRRNLEHLTFGHGVHFCLGAALARIESRIAFEELFRCARGFELTGDVERVSSIVFRGPTRLPVRLLT